MRVCIILLLLGFKGYNLSGQKTQILHESGFKHDYAISSPKYIEDLKDTTRLNYIATMRISGPQDYYLAIASWHDLIKIKAKELGANTFVVSSYTEDNNSVALIIRLFFGGERFLKLNALKRDTNAVHVFNQSHFNKDTGTLYLDNIKINFDAKRMYTFVPVKNKPTYIATNTSFITSEKIFFNKTKPSLFFVMPANKKDFNPGGDKHAPGNPEFAFRTGFVINGIPVTFRTNSPYELNYDLGRLVMAVYK